MSSKGGRCGLATNVLWKPVPGSGVCIHDGPLAEVEMCPSVLTDDYHSSKFDDLFDPCRVDHCQLWAIEFMLLASIDWFDLRSVFCEAPFFVHAGSRSQTTVVRTWCI